MTAHYDRVHALCRRMLGNDTDALDATQDTLVAALRALGRFDGRSSFGTWIYRIATNTCVDEMRRRRRRPMTGMAADVAEVADDISYGSLGAPGLFVVPTQRGTDPMEASNDGGRTWDGSGRAGSSSDPGSARVGGGKDARAFRGNDGTGIGLDPANVVAARVDVDVALASLPVEFRTAVVLRDVCDLPYDEIAEILGVPVGTVRSRIARARTALAATWHGEETGPGAPSARPVRGRSGNRSDSPGVRATENARIQATDVPRPPEYQRGPDRQGRPGPPKERSQEEERTQ